MTKRGWVFGCAGMVLAVLNGCGEGHELDPSELRALFSDATVEGHNNLHEYKFRSYYDPNGTFRSYQDASGRAQTAKWWIKGNAICIRWDRQATDLCRAVVEKDGRYRKVLRVNGNTKTIVTFDRFRKGNPENL